MKRQLEKEDKKQESRKLDFCPQSFLLPSEYSMFAEEFKKNPGVYIMKPVAKAQGKGIFLFNKLSQISDWKTHFKWVNNNTSASNGANTNNDTQQVENYIVQRYVDKPFLVGGKKFDLRIYVLVTSYMPLTVYLYRTGFARFSQFRFNMNADEIDNNFIHLTNVAIQKTTMEYAENEKGCKWDLRYLKLYMLSIFSQDQVDSCFTLIEELVLRSLFAVQKVIIQDKHCFEMYGYDILIDQDLKPWLLEVNASPSLTADTQDDYEMKHKLLEDMLHVVDMEKRLTGTEEHIGGFDLICKATSYEKAFSNGSRPPSLLGSFNDRDRNLKKLFRKKTE
jgi:tubulin polyglutamylase TTLL9